MNVSAGEDRPSLFADSGNSFSFFNLLQRLYLDRFERTVRMGASEFLNRK